MVLIKTVALPGIEEQQFVLSLLNVPSLFLIHFIAGNNINGLHKTNNLDIS